jgi:2-methylcitrate dehydratase PrpD
MVDAGAGSLTQRIARWVVGVGWLDVPSPQRELVKLRILDTVGLVLAALDTDAGKAALQVVQGQGGEPESVLIGTRRSVPAALAALAHGTIAHSRDFDDTFVDSVVHPGSFVIPVALAVGQAVSASGTEIMSAIAVGYEVAARLGDAFGRRLHPHGFHPSAVVGPVASAAVAGKLYGLTVTQIVAALGLAGSMSGGLMEFLNDGSWSKWLHLGWAAHGGITAAQFARSGFLGPATVLEGSAGLYRSFLRGEATELESIVGDLGQQWRGATAEFKYYPCAHVIQPYIDAALRLKAEHRLEAGDILEVRCAIAPWCVPLVCVPRERRVRPVSELDAIASLPFMVSSALVEGTVTLQSIEAASLRRADIIALAERVHHVSEPTLGAGFDGRIEVRTIDGRTLTMYAGLSLTESAAVLGKFRRNAATAFKATRVEAIQTAVQGEALDSRFFASLLAD